jgi:nucleoside-diphosphate-sugar epimerase
VEDLHVVIGSGVVGSAVVRALDAQGANVLIVTRSGSGQQGPRIRRVAANAGSVAALLAAAPTAVAVYNCANPRFHEWARDWPPIAAALLDYAERSGAVLATCSNLYGYGPVDVPMVETLPLAAAGTKGRIRAQMWFDAKARHDAGRVRVTEVRGSDYIVAGEQSRVGSARVMEPLLARKSVSLMGQLDQPHAWTSPTDVGRLLVQVATDQRGWGRAWHVPSNPPRTQRQVIESIADVAGVPRPSISQVPNLIVQALGLFNPVLRELGEVAYQMDRPYLLDDRAARETFGMEPTPWGSLLRDVVDHYRRTA